MSRAWTAGLLAVLFAGGPLRAEEPVWTGDARLAVRLLAASVATGSTGQVEAGLAFRVAPGWYTYWRAPGDAGIPPLLDWSGSTNVARVEIAWPAPRLHLTAGLRSNVYDRDVVLPLAVVVERPGEPVRLRAHLRYAGCSDICVPYEANLALDLPAGPAAAAPDAAVIARARATLPGGLAAAGWSADLVRRVPTGSGDLLTVRLLAEAGRFRAPELFVDAGPAVSTAASVRLGADGREAWLRVSDTTDAGEPIGPVSLTLVDGDRAASWTVPARP